MSRSGLGLAFALLCGVVDPDYAQQPSRTIYVSVADLNGRPVPGLRAADLAVTEDGRARRVLDLKPASAPPTVAVVVEDDDLALEPVRDGVRHLLAAMPADALVGLFSSTPSDWTVGGFTKDRATLARAIDGPHPVHVGWTVGDRALSLSGLIRHLSTQFSAQAVARPVMVVIAAGLQCARVPPSLSDPRCGDQGPGAATDWNLVVEGLQRSGTTMFALGGRHRIVIENGVAATGGRILPASEGETAGSMRQLIDELLGQYVVTYATPSVPNAGHRLRVTAGTRALTVRAPQRVY